MPLPQSHPDTVTIGQIRIEATVPEQDRGPWWSRRPSPQTIAMGTAGALSFAILLGLLLTPAIRSGPAAPPADKPAPTVTPAALAERFTFSAATEPYRRPDRAQVERAYQAVQRTFKAGGVSELARAGLACFRELEGRPTYAQMDYCLAFDLFAESQNARLIGGESPSPTSWFGSVGARHLNVAQSVMSSQGDADARLLDLRRMASDVAARHGGPPLIEAAPSLAPPPPVVQQASETVIAPEGQLALEVVEPALPVPTPVAAPSPRPAPRRSIALGPAEPAPAVVERIAETPSVAPVAAPAPAPQVRVEPIELPAAPQ